MAKNGEKGKNESIVEGAMDQRGVGIEIGRGAGMELRTGYIYGHGYGYG